jgi:hypothetical protein
VRVCVCARGLALDLRARPYLYDRTNTLAIIGQAIKVFSYFATILLKVGLTAVL